MYLIEENCLLQPDMLHSTYLHYVLITNLTGFESFLPIGVSDHFHLSNKPPYYCNLANDATVIADAWAIPQCSVGEHASVASKLP